MEADSQEPRVSPQTAGLQLVRYRRVIGSGLSRTGTRSIYAFLIRNGWPAVHYPFDSLTQQLLTREDNQSLWPQRSILDLPSALHFEKLARDDPDSLIVHTTRDAEEWVPAVHRHYQGLVAEWDTYPTRFTEFSEWISTHIYGAFPPNFEEIAAAGVRQQRRVDEWGRQNPERLVVVNVFTGEGVDRMRDTLLIPPSSDPTLPHITDADEVPLSYGLAERTLLWEEVAHKDA